MLGSELQLLSEEVAMLESRCQELIRVIGKWQNRSELLRELLDEAIVHCPHEVRVSVLEKATQGH